jgi:DNA-binding CsgD family transcriptional regulator
MPSVASMIEHLVDRLFLRALQFTLGGVLFGILFFPIRGRGSPLELATAATLLSLTVAALVRRRPLLDLLRSHPALTLLFPAPALLAVTLDGGFDSVWTPLVGITVGVPATLGLPWLSLGCALGAAAGQAAAAWINRADATPGGRVVETAVFNALGTVAVGVGIALCVATLADFLSRRPQILRRLREDGPPAASADDDARESPQRLLPAAPRTALSPTELKVVELLVAGRAPKQAAGDLGVALSTIRSHLKSAKRKTQARTLTELVGLFVIEDGRL